MSKSLSRVPLAPVLYSGSCTKQAAVVRGATADPAVVLQRGTDIRLDQKLLGQSDVSTAMIYRPARAGGEGARCPLDDLAAS
jgi:hypothetical protein